MMTVMVRMRSSLSELFFLLLLLLLLGSSGSGLGSVVSKEYAYFGFPHKWQDAQNICRSEGYNDLATVHTEADLDEVLIDRFYAWIGLRTWYQDSNWHWPDGPHDWENNQFDNWAHDEPQENDYCAVVSSKSERFYGTHCDYHMFFICQTVVNGNYDYKFVPQTKTWHEARDYCRDKFDDLAVTKDEAAVNVSVYQRNFPIWTGLRRDGQTWTWNLGSSPYSKWASNEPGNVSDCVTVSSLTEELTTYDCHDSYLPFLCMKENVVVVKETKTWEEALEHCRALGYELVSVQPGEDHRKVRGYVLAADTEKVWTGLRFLAGRWFWSDAAPVSDGDLPLCPNEIRRCGALAKTGTGSVETIDCAERLNFLCYRTP